MQHPCKMLHPLGCIFSYCSPSSVFPTLDLSLQKPPPSSPGCLKPDPVHFPPTFSVDSIPSFRPCCHASGSVPHYLLADFFAISFDRAISLRGWRLLLGAPGADESFRGTKSACHCSPEESSLVLSYFWDEGRCPRPASMEGLSAGQPHSLYCRAQSQVPSHSWLSLLSHAVLLILFFPSLTSSKPPSSFLLLSRVFSPAQNPITENSCFGGTGI